MLNTVKKVLGYGGLDRDVYKKYEAYILRHDMENLRVYIIVTMCGFLGVGLVSLFTPRITITNTKIYLMTAAAMLVLLLLWYFLMHRRRDSIVLKNILIYLYMAVIYGEGIALTSQLPDKLAVTFIGTILLLPLLFARRPAYTVSVQLLFTLIFCVVVQTHKLSDVAFNDTWNGITFFLVSAAEIFFVVPIRIKSLAQTQIIKELSEYDVLTGIKNRNSYEQTCNEYTQSKRKAVVVYVDANGLHELNNTEGHAAGDKMLKTIALELREIFGKGYVYRFGGDEFVIIHPHAELDWAREQIDLARHSLNRQGYSISYGCAANESEDESIAYVVKRAEAEMYIWKANYYKTVSETDRRR